MPRPGGRKDHPVLLRLPDADIAIIDRAAKLRGLSPTDFVRDAAVRAAEDVLMETTPIRMSAEGFDAFMAAVSGPAVPVPEMLELLRRALGRSPPRSRGIVRGDRRPRAADHGT